MSNVLNRLEGHWTMHTYIGPRLFEDTLDLSRNDCGELEGTVSVPGAFTAPVEHLEAEDSTHFSFDIRPDEGQGPFRVHYEGEFDPKADVFVGFATLPDEDYKLIGGFVGQRREAAI